MPGIFCSSCGAMLTRERDEKGNIITNCPKNCGTSQKQGEDLPKHNEEIQWQIFQYICLHPSSGIKQLMRHTNHSYETIQLEIIVLEEKSLIGYQLGKRKAHEYSPLMRENDLRAYKLILEKPRTVEDIVKATDSIANAESKRLDELEHRGILYSKTIDEFSTKRYYAKGRDYSLLLPKD